MKKITLLIINIFLINNSIFSQNVGIGTSTPQARFHIKGNADTSQLVIDANATQSNLRPLIRLRKSDGSDLLWIHSDDSTNIFIGKNAGRVNNKTGGGINNTFIGSGAGFFNSTGISNTGNGIYSLHSNSTGNYNTAQGVQALYSNSTGTGNTANGYDALYSNSIGISNTASGMYALRASTSGNNNTAHGYAALYSNNIGISNTASGEGSLYTNSSGNYNTAHGVQALYSNSTGNSNTANGYDALYSNSTGYGNTASGMYALRGNSTGFNNTANGYSSLYSNTTGYSNTANGDSALYSNTFGNENTANGYQALYSNTTGNSNTAIGYRALNATTASNGNVAIGMNAGYLGDYGFGNVFIGIGTYGGTGAYNAVAIGNGTSAVSNAVVLGNTNTLSFQCYGAYATYTGSAANMYVSSSGQMMRSVSSTRYKKNISNLDINSALIYKLRPVSYNSKSDDSRHFGLIAEEVAAIIPELAEFAKEKDVIKGSSSEKLIPDAVQYPLLSVLLLKEMQEQKKIIEQMQVTIKELVKKLEDK